MSDAQVYDMSLKHEPSSEREAACVLEKEVRTLIERAIVFRMRISTRACMQTV